MNEEQKRRYNTWVTMVHAAQKKQHVIESPYMGAKRITVHPDVDGDERMVEIWFDLEDDDNVVKTYDNGHEEVSDVYFAMLTIEQARAMHQALGQAIADAESIPDF